MKIKIHNLSQRRWVLLGLSTHHDSFTTKKTIVDKAYKLITGKKYSLVILDAISVLGKNYDEFCNQIIKKEPNTIYVVGDLFFKNIPILSDKFAKLLFNQKYLEKNIQFLHFSKLPFFIKIANGALPNITYILKDIFKYPKLTLKVASASKMILFAGQSGKHSILEILKLHSSSNDLDKANTKIESIFNQLEDKIQDTNIDSLGQAIIEAFRLLSAILEKFTYAVLQPQFKLQRDIVIFKSILRYAILLSLQKQGKIYLIQYPNSYLSLYNTRLYKKHLFLDFGGINGYEKVYPRMADIIFNRLKYYQFNQNNMEECQYSLNANKLNNYIQQEITSLYQLHNNL